jgi:type I restriction enzyme S subunit
MSWRTVRLGELVENFSVRAKDVGGAEGLDFFGVSNEEGIIKTKYAAEDKAEDYKIIEKGCFAYNPYRVNVGSIGLVSDETRGLISPAYVIFKPKPKSIIPELLFKFLKSDEGLRQIIFYARGTVRQALRFEDLCNIEISIPDYSEQEVLFNKLINSQKCSNILDSELKNQLNLLKKLRQQLLQDAVQGKLVKQNKKDEPASELLKKIKAEKAKLIAEGKLAKDKIVSHVNESIPYLIPSSWIWCRLNEIAEAIDPNPSHRMPHYVNEGIPFISTENFKSDDSVDFSVGKKVTIQTLNEHIARYEIHDDSFAFSRIGSIGKTIKLPIERNYCLSHALSVINPISKKISLKYLRFVMSTEFILRQAKSDVKSISVPDLGMAKIRNFFIPLPPLNEQNRIVEKVDEFMQYCNDLEESIKQSESQNKKLLQQVLREALRKEPVEA